MNEVSSKQVSEPVSSKVSVIVHLESDEDEGRWLTVSDSGIGMTPIVVKNYFLKAGASFRRSEAWKELHETSAGKSRVLRSGRFGIGILAAFLLGDRLEVKTRHVTSSSDEGIRFSCSIEDEEIELQRTPISNVGTTIRIRLSEETFNKLNSRGTYNSDEGRSHWEWYHLKEPIVERKITEQIAGKKKTSSLKPTYFLPGAHSDLPPDWHRISHHNFDDIHWHYPTNERIANEYKLFCNGIKVGGWGAYKIGERLRWPFSLKAPMLSVFDPDGKLPLNLERSQLTRDLPFERELLEDICRDLIAYLLTHTPTQPLSSSETSKAYGGISYRGLTDYYGRAKHGWFWSTPNGLALSTNWFLHNISPKNLYIFPHLEDLQFDIPKEYTNIYCSDLDATLGDFDPWVRFVSMGIIPTYGGSYAYWLSHARTLGRRIMISTAYEARVKKHKSLSKRFLSELVEEWRNDSWLVLCTPDCPNASVEFQYFAEKMEPNMISSIGEWYIKSVPLEEDSIIDQVWREIVKDYLIPFNFNKRKEQLATAFKELSHYIDSYRATIRHR
jgi:hypothetical protein